MIAMANRAIAVGPIVWTCRRSGPPGVEDIDGIFGGACVASERAFAAVGGVMHTASISPEAAGLGARKLGCAKEFP